MAIITTKYAFGWFGAEGEQCDSFDLSSELGTYSYSNGKLNFVSITKFFTRGCKKFHCYFTRFSHPESWTLDSEMNRFTRIWCAVLLQH